MKLCLIPLTYITTLSISCIQEQLLGWSLNSVLSKLVFCFTLLGKIQKSPLARSLLDGTGTNGRCNQCIGSRKIWSCLIAYCSRNSWMKANSLGSVSSHYSYRLGRVFFGTSDNSALSANSNPLFPVIKGRSTYLKGFSSWFQPYL